MLSWSLCSFFAIPRGARATLTRHWPLWPMIILSPQNRISTAEPTGPVEEISSRAISPLDLSVPLASEEPVSRGEASVSMARARLHGIAYASTQLLLTPYGARGGYVIADSDPQATHRAVNFKLVPLSGGVSQLFWQRLFGPLLVCPDCHMKYLYTWTHMGIYINKYACAWEPVDARAGVGRWVCEYIYMCIHTYTLVSYVAYVCTIYTHR